MLRKFHFHRFEFKYLVTPAQADEIHKELSFHMEPDPYAMENPDRSYQIRSLYFDNDSLDHYYEKMDGVKTRKKFRIRTYANQPTKGLEVYFEIKRRKNGVIIKDRANVPYEMIRTFRFENLLEFAGDKNFSSQKKSTLEEFLFDFYRLRMSPQVLISYTRTPLVDKITRKIRVTFDQDIRCLVTNDLFSAQRGRHVLAKHRVMEVKFSGSMPWWLHHVIQKYEIGNEAISKYCLGIETSGRETQKLVGHHRDYQWTVPSTLIGVKQ